MENFNAVGLWRDQEEVGKKKQPIDAAGTLSDGSRFTDFHGLKLTLAKKEDTLARGLYEALSSYALGRRIEFTDREEIDAALKELKGKQYRLKDMILHITTSENFRSK